jgi:hypothetical protein
MSKIVGLTKRKLYKRERPAARKKGVLDKQAPIGCPDANKKEIALALASLAIEAKVVIGRGGSYDALRDEYTVLGKVLDGSTASDGTPAGRVQDVIIQGAEVATLIKVCRMMNGGKLRSHANPR